MARGFKTRVEDSTYELNLAPMLDIIVSIVPMLLLSVAFVRITVIETPVPQVVEKAIAAASEKNKDTVQVVLNVSKKTGFVYKVSANGENKELPIALKGTDFDLEALRVETMNLKKAHPDVFRLELNPESEVSLADIVAVMDTVRTTRKDEPKIVFQDVETGKPIETNLVFPDVVFGNVAGG